MVQIIAEREYVLKIQQIRLGGAGRDRVTVTVVRGVTEPGVPTDSCPKHPAAVDCQHLQEASQFLNRMGF
jgi:hypothetical protein